MRPASPSSKSRRRTRSRKPRFLSLSRELAAKPGSLKPDPPPRPKPTPKPRSPDRHHGEDCTVTRDPVRVAADQRLHLFPLHPDPQPPPEEDDRHAAALLDPDYYYDATATLNSLLGAPKGSDDQDDADAAADDSYSVPVGVAHSPASSSPAGYGAAAASTRDLARAVLRGRERWVLCQQQVVEDQEEGEASSCGGAAAADHCSWWTSKKTKRTQLCFLKLDYDEVLSAWSGAGSVYVEGEAVQVVPDNPQNHCFLEQPAVFVEVGGGRGSGANTGSDSCGSNLWVVPENVSNVVEGREARVLRYREKRQNRLFAKRIRYEVRKLNAQKRPRIKGRFVKRMQEQD